MSANTPDLDFTSKGLFIGGEWVKASSGQTITTINPSNGDPLGDVPLANEADVDKAVASAKAAFPAWSALWAGEVMGLRRQGTGPAVCSY